MKFIQFFSNGRELLGSDGVCPVDGRLNLQNVSHLAKERAAMLNKNLNKGIDGFEVRSGNYLKSTVVLKFQKI